MLPEWDETMNSPALYQVFTRFVVIIAAALMVSFPFWVFILGHYGLEIVNESPGRWRAPLLYLENLRLLLSMKLSLWLFFSALGLFTVVKSGKRLEIRWICVAWLVITISFILYGYIEQIYERLGGGTLPSIVPTYHMVMYLDALGAVLGGFGIVLAMRFLLRWLGTLLDHTMMFEGLETVGTLLMMAAIILLNYNEFSERYDFTGAREQAELVGNVMVDRNGAYDWIVSNTDPSDVFVSNDAQLSMLAVMQAGRDLVAAPEYYSNPYVDWAERQQESETILESVRTGDLNRLAMYSEKTVLSYVMFVDERYQYDFLESVYDNGAVVIYRLRLEQSDDPDSA